MRPPHPPQSSPHPALLSLQAGNTVLELAPQLGGAIAALYDSGPKGRIDWLRPATAQALAEQNIRAMACYPLVPFCNRIRDGRFDFDGQAVALERNEASTGHAIHGLGWQHPWQVASCTQHAAQAEVVLDYRYQPVPGATPAGWPWAFEAQQRFLLKAGVLEIETRVHNGSPQPMPAGLGQHPYVPHRAGTRLQVAVEAMWQTDSQVMPTGALVQPAFLEALRAPDGALLAEIVVDNNFTGWQHEAVVTWPGLGRLTMSAATPGDFFVLYSPAGTDHFVLEPVTQCTDWVNLTQRFDATVLGGTVLAPGQTLSAWMKFDFSAF